MADSTSILSDELQKKLAHTIAERSVAQIWLRDPGEAWDPSDFAYAALMALDELWPQIAEELVHFMDPPCPSYLWELPLTSDPDSKEFQNVLTAIGKEIKGNEDIQPWWFYTKEHQDAMKLLNDAQTGTAVPVDEWMVSNG